MKKFLVMLVVVLLVMAFAAPAFAFPGGGMPGAHGVDGRAFGGAVSGLAQEAPLGLAEHVSGCFGPFGR